ncbi:MAG: 1-deoxy-D-xylulose-5-phosphate synthase [Chlamydiae bacterium]|nr:1-deoxy-D-xylulose-5-phosphate synthase [Chlamydiota bacterium]
MKDLLPPSYSHPQLEELSIEELKKLSSEIRQIIIDTVAATGGHLASNLGIVETTIALHKVFQSPRDKFIFDVSHQTYPHKLLTDRFDRFGTIRQYKGLCGFSHPKESVHDHFHAGHAGTALSLGLGVAKARDLCGNDAYVIPILGDASLTCGLTLEALNNIPKDLKKFIVILNDNNMSISKNVGAISNILSRFFNNPTSNKIYNEIEHILAKIPNLGSFLAKQGHKITESLKNLVSTAPFFEQFGLSYVGPIDGHNLSELLTTLEALKESPKPVLLHVITTKGKGMETAINDPTCYHGCKPFDKITGKFHALANPAPTFPQLFGKKLLSMAEQDPSIVVITPAMTAGSCLDEMFKKFPHRCIDVGIAEGHSVTFGGGIASNRNLKVICSIYATFLQRAFDNLFHDVCLQELPVVFAIDRGGISGPDGSTHHGIYDISFLNAMPNIVICQPRNGQVLTEIMDTVFTWNRPVAIRYPNLPTTATSTNTTQRTLGLAEVLKEGSKMVILCLGHMCATGMEVATLFKEYQIDATVIDPIFVKPLDSDLLYRIFSSHSHVITIEEHALSSGFASIINSFIVRNGFNHLCVANFGIPDVFLDHGSNKDLHKEVGLDPESIVKRAVDLFNLEKTKETVDLSL